MKRLLVALLCASMASGGCAARMSTSGGGPPAGPVTPPAVDAAVMRDYIRQLPIGAKVRLVHADGTHMRAILMRNDADPIVVQRRARIPEQPIAIAIRDIAAIELETNNGSTVRSVAIGAAAAVGATLGVLMLLAAIFAD